MSKLQNVVMVRCSDELFQFLVNFAEAREWTVSHAARYLLDFVLHLPAADPEVDQ